MKTTYIVFGGLMVLLLTACAKSNVELTLPHKQPSNSTETVKTTVYSDVQIVPLGKNQLVNESDVIVKGTVLSQEVQKDFQGFPVTNTSIQVETIYKGEPGEIVEIRVDGGETEDMVLIPDEDLIPSFSIGEEVIVFLSADKGNRLDKNDFGYYVVGQSQGNFSLKDDSIKNGTVENNAKTISFNLNNIQAEINQINKYNDKK